jgi:hypothetical protein
MKHHLLEAKDQFTQREEIHREEVARLSSEIIRLKIKCDEQFTEREMLVGFGDAPDMYIPRGVAEKKPRYAHLLKTQ